MHGVERPQDKFSVSLVGKLDREYLVSLKRPDRKKKRVKLVSTGQKIEIAKKANHTSVPIILTTKSADRCPNHNNVSIGNSCVVKVVRQNI